MIHLNISWAIKNVPSTTRFQSQENSRRPDLDLMAIVETNNESGNDLIVSIQISIINIFTNKLVSLEFL